MHHLSPVRWWCACRMRYMIGSRMLKFGDAMSIFARSSARRRGTRPPSCAEQSRGSPPTERSRYGLFLPGSVSVPRYSRISSAVRSSTYALPSVISSRPSRRAARSSRRRRTARSSQSKPSQRTSSLDGIDVLVLLLGRVGVVVAQVALAAVLCGDAEVQADRLGVADVQVAVGLRRETRRHPAVVLTAP